jgi:AmiR/NasT family two-component response regulator
MRRRVGFGLTVKTKWEVTAFVPGTRLENLITGFGYEMRELIVLAAGSGGTEATITDTLTPTSLAGRAMVAMSRGIIERDLETRYAKLKSVLEAGPPG